MNIGILSINMYTKSLNFACPIHSYAFQQFLLKNGYECKILDYKANYYDNFNSRNPSLYYSEKYEDQLQKTVSTEEERKQREEKLKELKGKRDAYQELYREREIRYDKFQQFIEANYKKTEECWDSDLLEIKDPGFDCYICATDVIWKLQPGNGFDRGYFLGSTAMENKWKIAYAASRGVPKPYTEEEKELFFHYINDISRISVREESLREYICQNSHQNPEVVLDPVFLHRGEFYDRILKKPAEENYVLVYYAEEVPKNAFSQAVAYAKFHKMKIVELNCLPTKGGLIPDQNEVERIYRYDVGPDEWLGYLKYAECVFTNSFHATCFSILFEKKFFVGTRHGDKITNLLEKLGLAQRKIYKGNPVLKAAVGKIRYNLPGRILRKAAKVMGAEGIRERLGTVECLKGREFQGRIEEIDYASVLEKLEEERQRSQKFILDALQAWPQHSRKEDYSAFKKALTYPVLYNSRRKSKEISFTYAKENVKLLKSGTYEYCPENRPGKNDGNTRLEKNEFQAAGYAFAGWNLRIRIDNRWFWYMQDQSLWPLGEKKEEGAVKPRLFKEEERIPYLPVNSISSLVAEAVWEKAGQE